MKKKIAERDDLEKRFREMAAGLAGTGLILQGTITERSIRTKAGDYGPYYQWTFKRDGKTVTVNLTAKQAQTFQKAIDNNRRLETTIKKMRELSSEICEAKTEGVKKRKPRVNSEKGLS